MIVSHARRFIFFHNPKCAGTSLREMLARHHDDPCLFQGLQPAPFFANELDFMHLRLWELQSLFPKLLAAADVYKSVILVRNPYLRFISAAHEHFRSFQRQVPLAIMAPAAQIETIELFIEKLLNVRSVTTDYRFVHFSPQLWFIRLGDRQIPGHVLAIDDRGTFARRAFERLGLKPKAIGQRNRARADLSHALASPKIAAFVRNFYAMDFEYFASDPALARLTELPTRASAPA